jgi:hypothetical protein
MYRVRRWSVRHAKGLEHCYEQFENLLVTLHPVFKRIGYQRLEKPVAQVEKVVKGVLFDCQMCGMCILSSTGMSCPMNCPKQMRNGPCGGVLANGNCEVEPQMRCVWVEAWEGSQRIQNGGIEKICIVQEPVDQRLQGRSSWLRAVRKRAGEQEA